MRRHFFAALLSFVMPGLGQVHNHQFTKGIILLVLEHILNKLSNINASLMLSFSGQHTEALHLINYDFALFYPGFYALCAYDSVINSDYNKTSIDHTFAPFWFFLSALLGCFGIFYARYIPMPIITVGLFIICIMLIGTYTYSFNRKIKFLAR
ncbi:hypothetical protein FS935_01070 [Metabacillus litoralis]|uniref:Uncharacterized protein n=1 Tax=Metabacillus litoralis TaxID=152268 RepID=A0A5C6W4V2_9BACI|nr:hypothetical protein [Metabacillus litoralis]TXC92821.1 hypothetical protein FS935_01070 [Metabacillus litoralis]